MASSVHPQSPKPFLKILKMRRFANAASCTWHQFTRRAGFQTLHHMRNLTMNRRITLGRSTTVLALSFWSSAPAPTEKRPQATWSSEEVAAANDEVVQAFTLLQDKATIADGIAILKRVADKGHAFAQYKLGISYLMGSGVEKDEKQALHYMKRAADQRDYMAQNDLGSIYYHGMLGVAQDFTKALELYTLSSKQGHGTASMNISAMYNTGTGVEKDAVKRDEYLYLAALQNNKNAKQILENRYVMERLGNGNIILKTTNPTTGLTEISELKP